MAAADSVWSCISDEEVGNLNVYVKEKIEQLLKSKQDEIVKLEADIEKQRVVADQHCFDLEKQLDSSLKNFDAEKSKTALLEAKVADLENKLETSLSEQAVIKASVATYTSQLENSRHQENELAAEKKDLLQMLEQRNSRIEQLNEEISEIRRQLTDTSQEKTKLLMQLDDASGQEAIYQNQLRRLQQENETLTKEVETLSSEVSQATNSLFNSRTELTHKVLDLQSKLDNATDELHMVRDVKESLQKVVDELNVKLETAAADLKEQRELNIKAESQFNHELNSQTKLSSLYKESWEEAQARVKELVTAVEEMQKLLKKAADDNQTLHGELEIAVSNFESKLSEKDSQISHLEEEMLKANDLLKNMRKRVLSESDVENLSPSAAAASRLLKSGKTLTEIYSEYIDISDKLQEEAENNAKLNMYLNQVLKEIEEKAPFIRQQQEDYLKALESLSAMTEQLNKSVTEHEIFEAKYNELNRKYKLLVAENDELSKSCNDLSQQVCCLLKEIEKAEGRLVVDDDGGDGSDAVSSTVTTPAAIVSENLVTFRNLQDLQNQNKRLLTVIRELSEKQQQDEVEVCDKRISDLRSELDEAMKEISELRDARDKQGEILKSIIRQREMYRVLFSQTSGGKSIEPALSGTSSEVHAVSSEKGSQKAESETISALQQLKEEFEEYKQQSSENAKIMSEQLEKLKEDRMELRLYSSKLSSQLEYTTERYNTLRDSSEGFKKEIAAHIARNEQLSNLVAKNEEIVCSLRNELMAIQTKLSRAEFSVENLRQEKLLLKQGEARLQTENESLRRERASQASLLANLQTIQNNLERADSDSKVMQANRITTLEKEVAALQSKLDQKRHHFNNSLQLWEKERSELLNKIQTEVDKHSKTRDELINAYSSIHELRQESSVTDAKLKTYESLVAKSGSHSSGDKGKAGNVKEDELSLQLKEAQSEIDSLKANLKKSSEHILQLKSISSSLEEELKEQNAMNEKFHKETEFLLQEKNAAVTKLEEEVEKLKQENNRILSEKHDIMTENVSKVGETRLELQKTMVEYQNALQILEECKKSETEARQEFQTQVKLARETQENYERELMLHANDLKALDALKKQYEGYDEKLEAAQEAAKKAEFALKDTSASWEEKANFYKEQIRQLEANVHDLEAQNQLLHVEMEKMSCQMIALQSREGTSIPPIPDKSDDQSAEHLLEIIRYLRKEKEIAVTKYDISATENERLSTKVKFLEKRLEETGRQLKDLQEKEHTSLMSAAQHSGLMRKVELLNILTDGNRLLRDEKTELGKRVQALEEKLTQLEAETSLLRERNQELQTKHDCLQAERKALQAEAKRWQTRTQHLVEQSSRTNPEEYKKAIQERDLYQKQVISAKDDLSRVRAELTASETQIASLRKECENFRTDLQTKQRDIAKLTDEITAKDAQLVEVNKTMQQVRKIGRKYRAQYDELKAQADEAAAKAAELREEPVPNMAEAIDTAKQETRLEMEEKVKTAEAAAKLSEDKMKKLRQTAYMKIKGLTSERDELVKQLELLKSELQAVEERKNVENDQSANVHFENRITNLEGRLQDAQNCIFAANKEKSDLKKEVEEMNQKVLLHQKHVEDLQRQIKDSAGIKLSSSTCSSRDTSILAQPGSDTGTPPTANIKPMATPGSSVVRHPHPPGNPPRSTPMGRIRPISAVSPAASRMATVPPTTATSVTHVQQQDTIDDGHLPSTSTQTTLSVPHAAVAPTPAVVLPSMTASVGRDSPQQFVIPHHTGTTSEDLPSVSHDSSTAASDDFLDEKATSSHAFSPEVEREVRSAHSPSEDISQNVLLDKDSTVLQSTSKRLREDTELSISSYDVVDSCQKKRVRVEGERKESDVMPAISITCASSADIPQVAIQGHLQVSASQAGLSSNSFDGESFQVVDRDTAEKEDEMEVILVESDEDELEDEKIPVEDKAEVEDEDQDEEEPGISEQFEEEEVDETEPQISEEFHEISEEHFEEPVEGGNDADDNSGNDDVEDDGDDDEEDDVEIIEQEEQQPLQEDGAENVPRVENVTVPVQSSHAVFFPRMPMRSDRYLPSLSRQQPVSFSSMSSGAGFEDGDSIVPSTPTLFDSRRSDGFAEAVSSPHVPPERFLFGNTMEAPSQLASQGALGMDDTRMDLTQLEEGSGRSVPSTPHQVSPLESSGADTAPEISTAAISDNQSSEVVARLQETQNVPTITVTSDEVVASSTQAEPGGSSARVTEEPGVSRDFEHDTERGPKIISAVSLEGSKSEESVGDAAGLPTDTSSTEEPKAGVSGSLEDDGNGTQQSDLQPQQRRATPIVWDPPVPSPTVRQTPNQGRQQPNQGRQQPGPPSQQTNQNQQYRNRPYARRSRPMNNPSQRMGYRHMGRGGRMVSRGRPFPRPRH